MCLFWFWGICFKSAKRELQKRPEECKRRGGLIAVMVLPKRKVFHWVSQILLLLMIARVEVEWTPDFHYFSSAGGVWEEWGEWSGCKKTRARACSAPSAAAAASCDGEPTETAPCSSESPCPNASNPGAMPRFWRRLFLKYLSRLIKMGDATEMAANVFWTYSLFILSLS